MEPSFPRFYEFEVLGERPITEKEWRRIQSRAKGPRLLGAVWCLAALSFLLGTPLALMRPDLANAGLAMMLFGLLFGGYGILPLRNELRVMQRMRIPVQANVAYVKRATNETMEVLIGPNLIWIWNRKPFSPWVEILPAPEIGNPTRDESDYSWRDGDLDRRDLTALELDELEAYVGQLRDAWHWYDWILPFLALIFASCCFIPDMDHPGRVMYGLIAVACLWRFRNALRMRARRLAFEKDRATGQVCTLGGMDESGTPVLIEYLPETRLIWRFGSQVASWRDA